MFPDMTGQGGQPSPYTANPNPFPSPFNSPFNPMNALQGAATPPDEPTGRVGRHDDSDTPPVVAPEDALELRDSQGINSGKFSRNKIIEQVKAAKAAGYDPYNALAHVWQESRFGLAPVKDRLGKVHYTGWAGVKTSDLSDGQVKEIDSLADKTGLNPKAVQAAVAMRDKYKYGQEKLKFTDEAHLLQAYNGYGRLTRKSLKGATKAYGVPVPESGIDMKANPLYGKRILQLKQDLIRNPEIKKLIDSVQ